MKVIRVSVKPKIEGERGLPKQKVEMLKVRFMGAEGDYNHYRFTGKGNTPDRAILIYPVEMMRKLADEGWPISPGDLGENITTEGIEYDDFEIGKRYRIGSAVLEITEPCNPCKNLSVLEYVGDRVNEFIDTMRGRRGWYARVVEEGEIQNEDAIIVLHDSVQR